MPAPESRPKPKPLPLAPASKVVRTKAGGWAAFTDGGTVPRWVIAVRVVLVLALAATIPTILGVRHGNRLVWTVCIAALPFFWMAFGYHLWRRICPLAVMGQLGRLVGRPGTRKMGDWMSTHYLLVQLGLMVVALSLRLSGTNGSALWLAIFLGVVVVAAIVTSFVYGGKTWCNFLCPVGLVEKIHTEPARGATGGSTLSSQCAPCVACKKHCPDIDLEQGYWKEAAERSRRIAYFAWPGIVVAFYAYYFLVSGSWDYYFGGRWAYDGAHALDPGFTFLPAIPVIVAAPLTLVTFGLASFAVFATIERVLVGPRLRKLVPGAPDDQKLAVRARVRHGMLAFTGLLAFNAFYLFAGRPTLERLPHWVVDGWGLVVVFASTAIFVRRFTRREDQYVHEKFAQKILKKWEWGDAPPSDDLKDIYLLHTERTKQREARLRAYKETVREMVADGLVSRAELVILDSLRAQLGIADKDHQKIVGELSSEERQLFDPAYQGSVEQRLKGEQYRKDLERIVIEAARSGSTPSPGTLEALRTERGVSGPEEEAELAHPRARGTDRRDLPGGAGAGHAAGRRDGGREPTDRDGRRAGTRGQVPRGRRQLGQPHVVAAPRPAPRARAGDRRARRARRDHQAAGGRARAWAGGLPRHRARDRAGSPARRQAHAPRSAGRCDHAAREVRHRRARGGGVPRDRRRPGAPPARRDRNAAVAVRR
ncbi:MAG: 4Fe-4S binding protein [Kofleriaceae bacterium]